MNPLKSLIVVGCAGWIVVAAFAEAGGAGNGGSLVTAVPRGTQAPAAQSSGTDSMTAPAARVSTDSVAAPVLRVPGDSLTAPVPAAPETLRLTPRVQLPDTVRVSLRRERGPEKKGPSPWWATIRSGILPGWGQLANHKPVKALILGGIYGYFAGGALSAERDRRSAREDLTRAATAADSASAITRVNAAVDRRNGRFWYMGATMLFAMLDAYVDAHFWGYDDEWKAEFRPTPSGGAGLAVRRRF